jgi:hypothetical protein
MTVKKIIRHSIRNCDAPAVCNTRQAAIWLGATLLATAPACETTACEQANVQQLVENFPRKARWNGYDNAVPGTFNSVNQPGFHY